MYLVYKDTIKNTGQRPGLRHRRYVLSTLRPTLGLYPPPPLGSTLRCWAMPFAVGFCPPLLGYVLRRWVLSSVVGLCPSPLGCTPPSLGCTLRRWAMPFAVGLLPSVVGLCPPSLGSTFCRWALSLWHLLSRRGGPSLSSLFPEAEAGLVGERSSVGWNERRNEENEPRRSSWFVFVTHYMGLPHPGSPLVFFPPLFLHRVNLSRPHPFGKGRGGCSGVRVLTF